MPATVIGLQPITKNADSAKSQGVELSLELACHRTTSRAWLSYSYANAELTNDAPNLITTINPPGFQTTVS